MRLRNADKTEVDTRKLSYLSRSGKLKFSELHGFDASRPLVLITALKKHPLRNPVEAVITHAPHGTKYTVRCSIGSPDRRDPCCLTAWIIDAGHMVPRFVSGYASPVPRPVFPNLA